MTKSQEQLLRDGCDALVQPVLDLLGEYGDDKVSASRFAEELHKLNVRCQALLHPISRPEVLTDDRRLDVLRSGNRFGSDQFVIDWAHKHGVVLGKGEMWWSAQKQDSQGHFHALQGVNQAGELVAHGTQGSPRITNGIDLWIECQDGKIFKGHRDNWVKDKKRPSGKNGQANKKPVELSEADKALLDLLV